MKFPLTTGQVGQLLGQTEPQVSDLVRRGKVPPPPIVAGRRLWSKKHLAEAAKHLGLAFPEGQMKQEVQA